MALDDVLVDVLVEKTVDGVEDLRLADAPAATAQQEFEDAPLAARKRKRVAVHLGLAPVEIDAELADRHMAFFAKDAPIDRSDARQDFAHVHGFAHHVVDPGGEQAQRVVERVALVQAEHRRVGALADQSATGFAFAAIADQERLDRLHVRVADLVDPFAELGGIDAGGRTPSRSRPVA